jgi:hypothetical protein
VTPIDMALADIFSDLGEGWVLLSLDADLLNTTTVGEKMQGIESFVTGWYKATIRNADGVTVTALGSTPGLAIATAAFNVIRQGERMRK